MSRRTVVMIIMAAMLAGACPDALAQLYPESRIISITDGLSDNRVTAFCKDSRGFVWIGTRNGLNRYDGHAFAIFRPQSGSSISNEEINDICEDKQGRIWVATMDGLNVYDPVQETWGRLEGVPNEIVWDIAVDRNGLLWIASDVFAFCSYDPEKRRFLYYDWQAWARKQFTDPTSSRYRTIFGFTAKNDHAWWLATNKGLVSLDIATGTFTLHDTCHFDRLFAFHYDPAHKQVFLTTDRQELLRYDETRGRLEPVTVVPEPFPSDRFLLPVKDEWWLAARNGVICADAGRGTFRLRRHIPQLSGSLLAGSVHVIYTDDTGIRWVGASSGLQLFDDVGSTSSFLPLLDVNDTEPANRMRGAFYDIIGRQYIVCAADPAAVFLINAVTGQIRKITTSADGEPLSACSGVRADRQGQLWLLTSRAVYRYGREKGAFYLFSMPPVPRDPGFRDMVQDNAGHYWFGSFAFGLYHYDPQTGKVTGTRDKTDRLPQLTSVTGLAYDSTRNLLLVSTFGEGLHVFDPEKREDKAYYALRPGEHEQPIDMAYDIALDPRGNAWIASHASGAIRYDPSKPERYRFLQVDMTKGLPSNRVISACSNGDSLMWLLGSNTISAIDGNGRVVESFGNRPAMAFASDNRLAHDMYFDKDRSELLIAAAGGLFIRRTGNGGHTGEFPLVLTRVTIDGTTLGQQAMMASVRRELSYRTNDLAFEFAGLYYGYSDDVQYQYRLKGYDAHWKAANGRYTIAYQNLPPGDYAFELRAVGPGNMHLSTKGPFLFTIVPPFWKTWWFFTAAVLLLSVGLYVWVQALHRRIRAGKLLNAYATSLYGKNTLEDIYWDTAKFCVTQLKFEDCVVYQLNEARDTLVQMAAFGPKNPGAREIVNRISIPAGTGIVGAVAVSGKAEIVRNTLKDARYIVDDARRLSEITVPIFVEEQVFGVIDSEHPRRGFYKRYHLCLLQQIAAVCAERLVKYLAEDRLRTKIARDLHDEVGATLTSINITSKIAMEGRWPEEKVAEYLQQIRENSGEMMESMNDIVWAINPANDSFHKVVIRMKEFAAEILEPAGIDYRFDDNGLDDQGGTLNLEQRKNLYMIFKEALHNIVKHSAATRVAVTVRETEGGLLLDIRDNGRGFDATAGFRGNGIRNMHSRAREMNAELRIVSSASGSTLSLRVT
ncbi:two-component regulator propeller domain-containing protein [Chitinophaga lutea]